MRIIKTIIFICFTLLFATPAFAEEPTPELWIYAANAGYKDSISDQNYDFIELRKSTEDPLSLAEYSVVYFNSSGNEAGRISFTEAQTLTDSRLVLGFAKSPQYADFAESPYVYNFGSSGMASTAGKVQILRGNYTIYDICWGKLECDHPNPKFATKQEDNLSLVRCEEEQCESEFIQSAYYPEIIETITTEEPPVEEFPTCDGLIISEILSYYIESSAEQFVELYNTSHEAIDMAGCSLVYKNKNYPLSGELRSGEYYVYQNPDLVLTKDPTSYNLYALKYASGDIFYEVVLPHGQKKGTSYSIFHPGSVEELWLRTHAPTPGEDNIYQEFQTCEEGKVINPETGNCIKEEVDAEIVCPEGKYLNLLTGRCKNIPVEKVTTCKDGYYLNPETGRCNKIKETTVSECPEGYERNPETNRCRKIRQEIDDTYVVADIKPEEYINPKIFIATGVIIGLALLGLVYVIFQYRKEIKQFILKVCRRNAS